MVESDTMLSKHLFPLTDVSMLSLTTMAPSSLNSNTSLNKIITFLTGILRDKIMEDKLMFTPSLIHKINPYH